MKKILSCLAGVAFVTVMFVNFKQSVANNSPTNISLEMLALVAQASTEDCTGDIVHLSKPENDGSVCFCTSTGKLVAITTCKASLSAASCTPISC